jgi:hypothetical protein
MKIDTQANVDACIEFIEAKNCYYLAKEGQIVYFASMTGREQDKDWIKLSVQEFMRIMSATKLAHDAMLMTADVIQAFQESDRVYEFGMKSSYGTAEGVFNYSEMGGVNLISIVCMNTTDVLMSSGILALTNHLAQTIVMKVLEKFDWKFDITDVSENIEQYFTKVGFDLRNNSRRPLVDGRKQIVYMMSGTLPAQVRTFDNVRDINGIVASIYSRTK